MKHLFRGLSALALTLALVVGARAEDKKPVDKKPVDKKPVDKKPEDKKPAANPFAGLFNFPAKIKLTEDQQKKVEDLKKEYTPRLEELNKKRAAIMTPERAKAAAEAQKKAAADGKKGKELQEAVQAALNLSADEKKQMTELGQAFGKLTGELTKKKMEILTDEQKNSLKPQPPKDKKPEPKKEKTEK